MRNTVYEGQSHTGLSPALWHDCPLEGIRNDPGLGYGFTETFTLGGAITPPTTTAALVGTNWSGFSSTTSQVSYLDAIGGGVRIAETTTDESTCIFSLSHCFKIGLATEPLWFEARVTPSHTATTEQGMFVGLADSTTKAVAVPLTAAASALADLNLVGFHKLDTDLTSIKTVYKADGVTAVTLETVTSALTAATAVKLGFKYQPEDTNKLKFFIDNVEQETSFTLIDDLGTGFPADVTMAPIIAMAIGVAAADNTLDIDWVSCYQLRA